MSGRCLTVALGVTVLGAAAPDYETVAQPPAGFAEVPDQSKSQDPIAFISAEPPATAKIPKTAAVKVPVAIVVAEAPVPLAAVSFTIPLAPLPVSLPPPMMVRVSFPEGADGARASADRVAAMLRAHGLAVELRGAERPPAARARIMFAFAEDRQAAETVDRTLRAAYGLDSPMTLAPANLSLRRPGLIEVALPG